MRRLAPRRRTAAATVLATAILLVAAACSSGGDGSAGGPAGSATPTSPGATGTGPGTADGTATGTAAPDQHPCAWPTRADRATQNIAYPDTAAAYWGLTYSLAPGERLQLVGRFPAARYFSFISYGRNGGAIDVLTDRDIEPDVGTNPFRPTGDRPTGSTASAAAGRYTFEVRGDVGDEAVGNVLGGKATDDVATRGSAPGSATTIPEDPPVDLLGSGGPDGAIGTVLYRVYVPDDPGDPDGGAGLPDVWVVGADGRRTPVPTCPRPTANPRGTAIVEQFGPATDTPAPATPVFIRPQGAAANLYPNPDNVYVATITKHQPGKVVVIRGRAPTFPDTRAGEPITGAEQVRYWSMCTNEYRKPYPVTTCATDADTTLDADGWYTFVVSTPEDRPAAVPATASMTWLDWGPTDVNGLLLMRHMLASESFPESAVNLAPGTLATSTMGDYAPRAAYCDTQRFEDGGHRACGL